VAAVDAADAPASNALVGGTPRLVAPGVAITAAIAAGTPVGLPGGSTTATVGAVGTAPRTGSSMAAAAASGTAALVWSYVPELGPHEVMDVVFATALPLARGKAEFCRDGASCDKIGRLRACAALQYACWKAPSRCDAPPACSAPGAHAGARPTLSAAAILSVESAFAGAPSHAVDIDLGLEVSPPACSGAVALGPARDSAPCVNRQYHGDALAPFALPQPGSPGDPDLPVMIFHLTKDLVTADQAILYVSRDAARDYDLADSTMILDYADARGGAQTLSYTLSYPIARDEPTLQFWFPVRAITQSLVKEARVAFRVAGTRDTSIVTPLIVGWR